MVKENGDSHTGDVLAAGEATQFRFQQIGAYKLDISSTTELAQDFRFRLPLEELRSRTRVDVSPQWSRRRSASASSTFPGRS